MLKAIIDKIKDLATAEMAAGGKLEGIKTVYSGRFMELRADQLPSLQIVFKGGQGKALNGTLAATWQLTFFLRSIRASEADEVDTLDGLELDNSTPGNPKGLLPFLAKYQGFTAAGLPFLLRVNDWNIESGTDAMGRTASDLVLSAEVGSRIEI